MQEDEDERELKEIFRVLDKDKRGEVGTFGLPGLPGLIGPDSLDPSTGFLFGLEEDCDLGTHRWALAQRILTYTFAVPFHFPNMCLK